MITLGVSSCFMYPDENRNVFSKKYLCYLERDMARYLAREDVLPVLIPDLEGKAQEKFLGEMDGFVFQGGTDMAPESYGEAPIGRWRGDAHRDAYELKILDYAIKNDKPVYGICRGFQLMNVYFRGTLYQDIATQFPEAIQHRDAEQYDQMLHKVNLIPGKLLDRLHTSDASRKVNSVHHQGVKTLGKDLEVLATCSADGLIEAFQWKNAPEGKVIGVQWHPEFSHNAPELLLDADLIYDHFLKYCKNLTYEHH